RANIESIGVRRRGEISLGKTEATLANGDADEIPFRGTSAGEVEVEQDGPTFSDDHVRRVPVNEVDTEPGREPGQNFPSLSAGSRQDGDVLFPCLRSRRIRGEA